METPAPLAEVAAAPPAVDGPTLEEYEHLLRARRRYLVKVDQPVVLISQAPRSGGTLLLRLFDGHPELHVVPWELSLDLSSALGDDPARAWERLHDDSLAGKFMKGFSLSHRELHGDRTLYPMHIPPSFHRALYEEEVASLESPTDRDLRNAYLTALFNAWLDNQNLYGRAKKSWAVVFTPRTIRNDLKVTNFRSVYPDGRLISVVRDPLTWFSSARRWSRRHEWKEADRAIDDWVKTVEAALVRKESDPETTVVITFEDLLSKTGPTMKMLTSYLGIRLTRDSTSPTMNKLPIRANSSFKGGKPRVSTAPLHRAETELSKEESEYIKKRAWGLYRQAIAVASRPKG
jgi:hypothetical protein